MTLDIAAIKARAEAGEWYYHHEVMALIAALEASEAARVKAEQERDALKEALRNLNELNENYAPFGGEIFQDRVERAWGSARAVLTAYDKREQS